MNVRRAGYCVELSRGGGGGGAKVVSLRVFRQGGWSGALELQAILILID